MKKFYIRILTGFSFVFVLVSLIIGFSTQALAQVGIGTTTPKAALQVVSPNSGMLIPRYATLANANAVSLPTLNATDHKGLMIYVDEVANRGFWFYDGAAFVKVGTPIGALPIANGGTGNTTAGAALNALLPAQSSNAGKVLTTDGTNTSWQKPASRTRSIILDMGSIDVSAGQNGNPPTKSTIGVNGVVPVIGFVDNTTKTLLTQIPIPADWNGTTPFSLTFYYSSGTTTGEFTFLIAGRPLSLTDAITDDYTGYFFQFATSSSPNKLMKKTISLDFIPFSASSEVLQLAIQRQATNVPDTDTANGYFNLLGIRIDYQD